jgi:hypothetical protein
MMTTRRKMMPRSDSPKVWITCLVCDPRAAGYHTFVDARSAREWIVQHVGQMHRRLDMSTSTGVWIMADSLEEWMGLRDKQIATYVVEDPSPSAPRAWQAGEDSELLCPQAGCGEPLHLERICYVLLWHPDGIAKEWEGDGAPWDDHVTDAWKVACVRGHVLDVSDGEETAEEFSTRLLVETGDGSNVQECPACEGEGVQRGGLHGEVHCPNCGGEGRMPRLRWDEVPTALGQPGVTATPTTYAPRHIP